jgi:hypothetical protein
MLALRNPMDSQPADTSGIRMAGLLGSGSAPPPAPVETKPVVKRTATPKPAAPPPPPPADAAPASKFYTVEAIRAAKRTEEIVR